MCIPVSQLNTITNVLIHFFDTSVALIRVDPTHVLIQCNTYDCGKAVRLALMQAGTWAIEVKEGNTNKNYRYIKVHFNKGT